MSVRIVDRFLPKTICPSFGWVFNRAADSESRPILVWFDGFEREKDKELKSKKNNFFATFSYLFNQKKSNFIKYYSHFLCIEKNFVKEFFMKDEFFFSLIFLQTPKKFFSNILSVLNN